MSTLVVAAAQLPACADDPDKNLAVVEAALTDAAAAGAGLVVFPELAATPYFCGEPPGAYRDWAQPVPGPQTDSISVRAAELGVAVVLPLFERDDSTHTFRGRVAVLADLNIIKARGALGLCHGCTRIYGDLGLLFHRLYLGINIHILQVRKGVLQWGLLKHLARPTAKLSLLLHEHHLITCPGRIQRGGDPCQATPDDQ